MMGVWFAVALVVFIVVISLISRTPSVKEEKPNVVNGFQNLLKMPQRQQKHLMNQ